ncbi:SUMF1/EgtB/PvdO family nonheme iron enzyme [Bradyrhizobium sp. 27S5]|uniref:nSTAND1 domain-containing NTPase n=1 Tax=Bradyrhizobium sp. 27S5 TaxID=3139728 RepID=UPI0030D55150
MQRWFISYHSPERPLAERIKEGIERHDASASIFFAPASMRAGGFWTNQLAQEIATATVFVLVLGECGIGPWQVLEYGEALDRKVTHDDLPIIVLLQEGQTAPGLPFLRRLHWIVSADLSSQATIALLFGAAANSAETPEALWRYTSPYRGLSAMEQKDSDYFFGRAKETTQVLRSLHNHPDKVPILLGNSGVGKSSVAQAGVLAAMVRQRWPEESAEAWPASFNNSRRWCVLSLRPGATPIKSLVEAFLATWQLDGTTTDWPDRRKLWIEKLLEEKLDLQDLIDQTCRRYVELNQAPPASFFLYVDQGEELYSRSDPKQRQCFSKLLERGVVDGRIRALMSMRSDFLGELQSDASLYRAHIQINVPPLREDQLLQVVGGPAKLLSARFESDTLPDDLAKRAADDSIKDAGALPLLSYLLDGMWKQMVERGDGILRLPHQSIDLGRVLVDRANLFISSNPGSEDDLRRIFTLRLATVREDGEPTRRRASRSEFLDAEWRLVTQLANDPYRLLSTFTPEMTTTASEPQDGERVLGRSFYAEVAHEAIFRRWDKLRSWISSEREFLTWRTGLELARRAWDSAPSDSKDEALLLGLALKQALTWLASRSEDIPVKDREFITRSRNSLRSRRLRAQAALVGTVALILSAVGLWEYGRSEYLTTIREAYFRFAKASAKTDQQVLSLDRGQPFADCAGCPEMVAIPVESFLMGAPGTQGLAREHPQHKVSLTRPFAVSRNEISFDEWNLCVANGDCEPRHGAWEDGNRPVINITWNDAKRYVSWLSRVTRQRYRLLSEAEWEYSARAGGQGLFSFGNDDDALLKLYAWYDANSDGRTNPVGSKKANAFGLHDMHGNVAEWVEDCAFYEYSTKERDGSPWVAANCGKRVIRGGSWRYGPFALRSAARDSAGIDTFDDDRGMRVARDLAD